MFTDEPRQCSRCDKVLPMGEQGFSICAECEEAMTEKRDDGKPEETIEWPTAVREKKKEV